jgi:hypothetical protein
VDKQHSRTAAEADSDQFDWLAPGIETEAE